MCDSLMAEEMPFYKILQSDKWTHTRQLKTKIASTVCPETLILKIKSKHNSFTKFSHCQQL
jgi:hypothetical protein